MQMQILFHLCVLLFIALATFFLFKDYDITITVKHERQVVLEYTTEIKPRVFFVYGSLRPDDITGQSWTSWWLEGAIYQRAEIYGIMYDDVFAAVILDANRMQKVQGYVIYFEDDVVYSDKLKIADRIEGTPSLYQREHTVATLLNERKKVDVWVYTRKDADLMIPIKSGDWVLYQQRQQEMEAKITNASIMKKEVMLFVN